MLQIKLAIPTLRRTGRVLRLALRKAKDDRILQVASALAFVTALSIIPLLATLAFIGDIVFPEFQQHIVEILSSFLPYTDVQLVGQIRAFLDQTRSFQGPALLALFVSAFLAYTTVEMTLNDIWQVSNRRSLRERLVSFILLLFGGPILIGLSFSGLPILLQFPGLVERPVLIEFLVILGSMLVLGLFYWLLPHTRVDRKAALIGGVAAGLLLSLMRSSFSYYVGMLRTIDAIYGTFAFVFFFLVSIQLAWAIALFGSVLAYTIQHRHALDRGLHRSFPLEGRWAGLAALVALASGLHRGEPITPAEDLADRLGVPPADLPRALAPLREEGWVQEIEGQQAQYLLAIDPHKLTLRRVFEAYDQRSRAIFDLMGEPQASRLLDLVRDLAQAQQGTIGDVTIAALTADADPEGST